MPIWNDVLDLPLEQGLRLRMLENKRRSRHLVLRGSAVVMLLTFMGMAVVLQQAVGNVILNTVPDQ